MVEYKTASTGIVAAGKALLTAEVDVDGASVLTARFRNFTMELKQNDTGDGENLG